MISMLSLLLGFLLGLAISFFLILWGKKNDAIQIKIKRKVDVGCVKKGEELKGGFKFMLSGSVLFVKGFFIIVSFLFRKLLNEVRKRRSVVKV